DGGGARGDLPGGVVNNHTGCSGRPKAPALTVAFAPGPLWPRWSGRVQACRSPVARAIAWLREYRTVPKAQWPGLRPMRRAKLGASAWPGDRSRGGAVPPRGFLPELFAAPDTRAGRELPVRGSRHRARRTWGRSIVRSTSARAPRLAREWAFFSGY